MSFISKMFSPGQPMRQVLEPPPPPPPVPTIDNARVRQQNEDALRRKKGRQASVLTGPEGVGATPLGTKTLIGS